MKLQPKNYKQSQLAINIIEHLMITILIFIVSFAGIFFIGVRKNSDFVEYLLEHGTIYISICLSLVMVANIYYVVSNMNKKNIRYFHFNDDTNEITIGLCKNYINKIIETKIQYENICYRFKKSTGINTLSDKLEIEFFDKEIFIGNLEPKGFIWSTKKLLVKRIMEELHRINAAKMESQKSNVDYTDIIESSLFRNKVNVKSKRK
jgi:hypothetical protein